MPTKLFCQVCFQESKKLFGLKFLFEPGTLYICANCIKNETYKKIQQPPGNMQIHKLTNKR